LPPHAHGEPEKACLSRRIPFLVEKPLGNDISTVTDILGMINRTQAMTAVGYMNRYRRSLQRGRELLRGNKISTLEAHWIGGTPGVAWWRKKAQSGGQHVEQTTHLLDSIAYLAGRVTEVYAVGAHGTHADPLEGYDVEDATSLSLKFASGAVGSVNSCCTVTNGTGGVGLDIYSPAVTLSYGGWDMSLAATKGRDDVETVKGEENIFEVEAAAFITAVETGDASHIRCDYGQAFHAHQIAMAANESLATGRPVKIGS
jgi:myo-inositol 2-dehydrogenase / D-chiro-inositol 1-dehydrogenase